MKLTKTTILSFLIVFSNIAIGASANCNRDGSHCGEESMDNPQLVITDNSAQHPVDAIIEKTKDLLPTGNDYSINSDISINAAIGKVAIGIVLNPTDNTLTSFGNSQLQSATIYTDDPNFIETKKNK